MTYEEATQRSLKDTIKSLRVANDLLLWQVASSTGITKLYLERIEEGKAVPPEEVVKLLAKVLKTDEEALVRLWQSEQPTAPELPTEPKISPEAREREIFGT
jgi:transcriptional regulator with XRE-family HTH domain